ncbi:MAG: potassium channel protein [Bacteroidales bacterium]|nr:potassium channel protein [Bacteroidales bacterium]
MYRDLRKLYYGLSSLIALLGIGTSGYMLLEKYTFLEALFMTVISVSTVGFEEVHPLSNYGMIFTIFLIFISFGIFAYVITSLTQFLLDGEFQNYLKNRKVNQKIQKLNNHTIICGFGRNGKQAAIELISHDETVLIIEKSQETFDNSALEHLIVHPLFTYIIGDATHDEILEKAKIFDANALITTLPDDANNLFVVLTARVMNPKLTIVARASDDHSDIKLKRAGADNVIMPDKVGGSRMAKLVVEPDLIEFIENLMVRSTGSNVNLIEIDCKELKACFINKSIRELHVRSRSGANLLGIKREDNTYDLNPAPDTVLNSNYKVFALGTPEQIVKLKQIFIENNSDNKFKAN